MSSKITKTEVSSAIADCEAKAGWSTLDRTPVTVDAGHLRALVEAAKCARYDEAWHGSDSYLFLSETGMVGHGWNP